jgi:hypothetical protein
MATKKPAAAKKPPPRAIQTGDSAGFPTVINPGPDSGRAGFRAGFPPSSSR